MDRLRTLSDRMLVGLGLSSAIDKPKDEESTTHVADKRTASGSPELADASNRDLDLQAIEHGSSEDESDDCFNG